METVQAVYFCYAAKPANLKIGYQNGEKKVNIVILSSETTRKSLKDWDFTKISKMDEEDVHSPGEFYYPEDLETLDAETERGRFFFFQKQSVIIVNNLLTEHWGPWSLHSDHTATTSGHFSTLRFRTM